MAENDVKVMLQPLSAPLIELDLAIWRDAALKSGLV